MSTLISQLEAELPEYLLCPICNSFLTDGGFINEHGNTYCGVCINSLNGKDPLCQRNFISIIPNRLANNFATLLLSSKLVYASTTEEPLLQVVQKPLLSFSDVLSLLATNSLTILQSLKPGDFATDVQERDNQGNHLVHLLARDYPQHLSLLKHLPFANMNVLDYKGRAAFHLAIRCCSSDLNELITRGADINLQDDKGRTPLVAMLRRWQKYPSPLEYEKISDRLEEFLAFQPNVNLLDKRGMNALHYAIRGYFNTDRICRSLLDKGIDVNVAIADSGYTPLLLAVMEDKDNVVAMLLNGSQSANVNATSNSGHSFAGKNGPFSALHIAIDNENPKIISRLLQVPGCLVDVPGFMSMTPLHRACEKGNLPMVILLVQAGADIQVTCKVFLLCCGKADAFHFAARHDPSLCQFLILQGKYSLQRLHKYKKCASAGGTLSKCITLIDNAISMREVRVGLLQSKYPVCESLD